ncbi:MAG: hypothetical protein J6O41_05725, partial [Clostridia bacterium]|nr:hypothetical protein [Clostridia bacterium]
MGASNCCNKHGDHIPTRAEYYFIKNGDISYSIQNNDMRETAKLEVKIKGVFSGNAKVHLILYSDSERKNSLAGGGETESASCYSNTNEISFNKFFIVNYFFEKEQPIDFVISGSLNGKVSTTLSSILGARGQTQNRPIEGISGATLEIKGFSYKNSKSSSLYFKVNLNGKFNSKGLLYTIKSLGNMKKPKNILLYKSELINAKLNLTGKITFITPNIPDIYLDPDINYNENNVEVAIYDYYNSKELGKFSGPLSQIVNKEVNINLGESKSARIEAEVVKNYIFLDYICGGMQINLTVAVDFTASNGNPDNPMSLHYGGNNSNSYEIAIRSCGNIVAYYNYDQLFHAYGFGGKFCGNNVVSHCYPLNMNMDNPDIQGIEGIIQAYKNILNQTILCGPSYFHEIINKVVNIAKEDVLAENKMNYNVLMFLTAQIFDDMDETIDALVEASFYPISVIIVGIGDADFSSMDVLDADIEPLIDSRNRKAY